MLNNELLGTLLGDGYMTNKTSYTRFCIEHCPEQLDYLEHKADILRNLGSTCIYKRKTRNIFRTETTVYDNFEIYNKYYPKSKKSVINILNDVTNPILAVAYWLMDDGCIHSSTKNKGKKSPRLLLATCSESKETLEYITTWFKEKLNLDCYVSVQRNHSRKKEWFLIKFPVLDSLLLWEKVRGKILHYPSMQHKFRLIETEYQNILIEYNISKSDEQAVTKLPEDICRAYAKRKRKK